MDENLQFSSSQLELIAELFACFCPVPSRASERASERLPACQRCHSVMIGSSVSAGGGAWSPALDLLWPVFSMSSPTPSRRHVIRHPAATAAGAPCRICVRMLKIETRSTRKISAARSDGSSGVKRSRRDGIIRKRRVEVSGRHVGGTSPKPKLGSAWFRLPEQVGGASGIRTGAARSRASASRCGKTRCCLQGGSLVQGAPCT